MSTGQRHSKYIKPFSVSAILFFSVVLCSECPCLSYNVYIGKPNQGGLPSFYFDPLMNYFNSQPDINYIMAQMMPTVLTNYDLYITGSAGLSTSGYYEYSSAEVTALWDYLNAGGRVLFFSDHTGAGGPGKYVDPYLNLLLPQLGSGMSLNGGLLDGGGHHDSIPGQILSDPFTQDVELIRYAGVNTITGGTPLFLASNLTKSFFSYEHIGSGCLFLSGDINLMDLTPDPAYDNGQFFRNLITIPEPTMIWLLGLGGLVLRKNHRRGR